MADPPWDIHMSVCCLSSSTCICSSPFPPEGSKTRPRWSLQTWTGPILPKLIMTAAIRYHDRRRAPHTPYPFSAARLGYTGAMGHWTSDGAGKGVVCHVGLSKGG